MAEKKAQTELIVWRDAWQGYNYSTEPDDIKEGCYLISSGFLVKETKDEVILAVEISAVPSDSRVRHVQGILKKNIVSRTSRKVRIKVPS